MDSLGEASLGLRLAPLRIPTGLEFQETLKIPPGFHGPQIGYFEPVGPGRTRRFEIGFARPRQHAATCFLLRENFETNHWTWRALIVSLRMVPWTVMLVRR